MVYISVACGLVGSASDAAGVVFVGIALEEGDNITDYVPISRWLWYTGAAATVSGRVQKNRLYHYSKTGALQTNVGKVAFVLDGNTLSTAATTKQRSLYRGPCADCY